MSKYASIIKVTDSTTGALKRWESEEGHPLAIMSGDELVLTDLGRRMGYAISLSGKSLMKRAQPAY